MNPIIQWHTIVCALVLALVAGKAHAQRFSVTAPEPGRARLVIADPDAKVRTLGKPTILFDLAAGNDTLLDLRIRRSALKLASGQAFTAFAGHKGEDLVIIASGNVASISIVGVRALSGGMNTQREALVLFRKADGSLVAPAPSEVAVFNSAFKRLDFAYDWAAIPDGTVLPINLLLDVSGSMQGALQAVIAASKEFLSGLPSYARCRVLVFNENVTELTDPARQTPCAQAAHALSRVPAASGGTALFEALRVSFERNTSARYSWETGMPNITLVVTDGIDSGITDAYGARVAATIASGQKRAMDNKLFVFWAGNADPSVLAPVADLQVSAGADLRGGLEGFLRDFGVSLTGLQLLTVTGR